MVYRHEWKHVITYEDLLILRQRLRSVMKPDENAEDGKYYVRSLYFDTPSDRALREKIDGVSRREKFRLRCYNGNTELIHLEKKCKLSGLCSKQSAEITKEKTRKLLEGNTKWMMKEENLLFHEFYTKIKIQQLHPKTIVDYVREPYVFRPGNVRVTLDYDIRTGLGGTDFLNPDCQMIPAGDRIIILEVKWDEFLPEIIRMAVGLKARHVTAFSKYAQCRIYD